MAATSPPLVGRQVGKPVGIHRKMNGSITVSILVDTRCYCINTSNWEMAEEQASRNACKCQQGFDGIAALVTEFLLVVACVVPVQVRNCTAVVNGSHP